MAADRRIDAAGGIRQFGEQRLVERLAHAVQPLKFEALDAAGVLDDAGDGQRVVGGELRIKRARAPRAASWRRPCSRDRSSPCA